ncbi:MAG: hypothetical protein WKG01_19535 [Kofleriaceae bacterium]
MRGLFVVLLTFAAHLAAACANTEVDPEATGFEITTQIVEADGVTQLSLSGWVGSSAGPIAFAPGVVPEVPRALSGQQSAVVLLPDDLDGSDVFVRVDALAGQEIVHTGAQMIPIRRGELRRATITLGEPANCGDGVINELFEQCDDVNVVDDDGCSVACQMEAGWNCVGTPSQCAPLSSSKEIMAYAFLAIANPGLKQDVMGTIQGTTITLSVPFGTNIGGLVATFASTGATVRVAGASQVSGQTPNNFGAPITYTIVADDGSVRTYDVAVAIASATANDITSYAFLATENSGLAADVVATISGTAIAATLPAGTNITSLVATFSATSGTVTVGGTAQVSGATANNFTSPVTYTVTAADSSTKVYTVTVNVAASSANDLTSFVFRSANNPTLPADVSASIVGTTITASLPSGANVTGLVATFVSTGASVTVNGITQSSSVTANNFSTPVSYVVTAANSATKTYSVNVTVAPNSAKAITSFVFASAHNSALNADVVAAISGTQITATVPAGTNVTALVATFATTGAQVRIDGVLQTSSVTANNFSSPRSYVVTAADGSTQTYTVTVNVAVGSAKDITSYVFLSSKNPSLPQNVVATISGTTITATLPSGTNLNNLIASFQTTGVTVEVGNVTQNSGITRNNFTSSVTYTVTAADSSTKIYTVTLTGASTSQKDITEYSFLSANNPGLAVDVIATITGQSIMAVVPPGTNKNGLVATFSTTGTSVRSGGTPQVSGVTPNNFTMAVNYIVTAANNSSQQYTVTVSE